MLSKFRTIILSSFAYARAELVSASTRKIHLLSQHLLVFDSRKRGRNIRCSVVIKCIECDTWDNLSV
jgi:hypothetical protein